jgi:hypothetical protein
VTNICITKEDYKGPKEDDEISLKVSADGCTLTFKGTACVWQSVPPLPEDMDLSGWWRLIPAGCEADVVNFRFDHTPGSTTFAGYQKDYDEIRNGCITGEIIEWTVDVFRITGRIVSDGRRLADLEVRSELDSDFLMTYRGERSEDPTPGLCAICLEDLVDGEQLRTLKCDHQFHTACVAQWLAIANHCPTCRCQVGE